MLTLFVTAIRLVIQMKSVKIEGILEMWVFFPRNWLGGQDNKHELSISLIAGLIQGISKFFLSRSEANSARAEQIAFLSSFPLLSDDKVECTFRNIMI
jgi:hypothetical protein